VSHDRRPAPVTETPEIDSTVDNTVSTTEEDTGLTAAMLDKAALDLYAIFQQTQDENASNFVDENATESRLDEDEEKENTTEVNNYFFLFRIFVTIHLLTKNKTNSNIIILIKRSTSKDMHNINSNEVPIKKINSTKFHQVYLNACQIGQCTYIM
jgi:hypothetical protein